MIGTNQVSVHAGYFGVAPRCFGVLHQPAQSRKLAAIIVNDFGYPGLTACWSFRKLADEWAALGITVLRIDLPGTGDAPELTGNRVAQWQAGVNEAIQYIRSHDQQLPIVLVGLRIGALLAANAAFQQRNIVGLQLIQPTLTGSAYVQQAESVAPLVTQAIYQGPEGRLLSGHFLQTEEFQSLLSLSVNLAEMPTAVSVYSFQGDHSAEFVQAASAAGWQVTQQDFAEKPEDWLVDAPFTHLPGCFAAMTTRLKSWCGAPVTSAMWQLDAEHHDAKYGERYVRCVDADGSVQHGILALPPGVSVPESLVILFGTAANRRTGIHDNNVYWARALAASGVACLRFDATGFGDSPPRPGHGDNDLLVPWNHTDADAWLRMLRDLGVRRFGVAGLSSGGYNAYQCALAHADVVALFGINVARFVIRQSIHEIVNTQVKDSGSYLSAVRDPNTWLRLLKGEVAVKRIASALLRRVATVITTRLKLLRVSGSKEVLMGEAHGNMLKILQRSGTRVKLLYSVNDIYFNEFEQEFGPRGELLTTEAGFRLVMLADADHCMSQQQMAWRVTDLLKSFFRETL